MLLKERRLPRLRGFDYSSENYYYVTICTKNRINYLGKILNGEMFLNQYGEIVQNQWKWLQNQYKYVYLDEYIIMPNHLHGIIYISHEGKGRDPSLHRDKIKPLPELIGAFKTTSSKLIHQNKLTKFKWQNSFHERIIRNDKGLNNIRNYIKNNPLNWELDELR